VLENQLDAIHFTGLHQIQGEASVKVLDKPYWEPDDDRWPIFFGNGAWFGAVIEIHLLAKRLDRLGMADRVASLLGISLDSTRNVTDMWPSGVVQRIFLGERHTSTVLTTTSPFSLARRGESAKHRFYMLTYGAHQGNAFKTSMLHLLTVVQTGKFLKQDISALEGLDETSPSILVKEDAPLITFRRWYGEWRRSHTGFGSAQTAATHTSSSTAQDAGARENL
jgi:hypothetical protein